MHRAGYFLREGAKGLKSNLGTTIGSIITIFLSLLIIGLFLFGNAIINNVVSAVESQVSITAYLSDEAPQEQIDAVSQQIREIPHVVSVEFTSKDKAMEDFKGSMSENSEIISQLDGENPLPASLAIELDDPKQVNDVANTIANMESYKEICDSPELPATSVKYGQKTVERLFSFTDIVRNVAIGLVILLIFISFIFMNNTIRLSVMNRRREISIQKLVGAANSFVKGPFLAEGAIHALIGAALAIATLEVIHHFALPKLSNALTWLPMQLDVTFYVMVYIGIVIAALLIGVIGSSLAMRKYLDV